MPKRLSIKHGKMRKDMARAFKEGSAPKKHKVAEERSEKAKLKKAYRK